MSKKDDREIQLRPYQQECVDKIDAKDSGRFLISLATGLGKTVIFSHLKRNGRTLILSHRDELVKQPQKYYDCSFGIEKAEITSNGEEVVSASVQSMCRPNRLARFSPDSFDTIILDEAHHASAGNTSYMSILNYFSEAKRIIGFTATPKRGDKIRLSDVFEEILYSKDIKWGIENGYLCRIRAARVIADYSLNDIEKIAGDYALNDVDKKINTQVLTTTAKVYVDQCMPQGKHVLVYCPTKRVCYELAQIMRSSVPKSDASSIQVLLGDTDPEERRTILEGFRTGTVKVIINCMVLTEGTDLPICDAIINLRPTTNSSLYQQIIGRGTRLFPGKEYLTIYDILPEDVNSRRGICSAPSLFGIEPENVQRKYKARFTDNEDLLDLCNTLNQECADIVKRMDLHVEMMDAFIEEANGILSEANSSSLVSAYHNLEERNAPKEGSINFGDKLVLLNPSAENRYEIHPTYRSKITISEPDILGNVVVNCDTPDISVAGIGPRSRYNMRENEAVEFVDMVCNLAPQQYIYAWSKEARERWSKEEASQKQIGKVLYELNSFLDTKGSFSHSKKITQGLTKLQAGDYIDYINQIKDASEEKKTYYHRPKAHQSTIDALTEKFEREHEIASVSTDETERILKSLREKMGEKDAEEKEKEALVKEIFAKEEYVRVKLPVASQYCSRRLASYSQQSYADQLYQMCSKKNVSFDSNIDVCGSSTYCSLLIALFRWLQGSILFGLANVIIDSQSVLEAEVFLDNTLKSDVRPAIIDVYVRIKCSAFQSVNERSLSENEVLQGNQNEEDSSDSSD